MEYVRQVWQGVPAPHHIDAIVFQDCGLPSGLPEGKGRVAHPFSLESFWGRDSCYDDGSVVVSLQSKGTADCTDWNRLRGAGDLE